MKLLSQSFGVMFALIYTFPKSMVIRPFCLASTAPSRILSSNTAPSEIKKRSSFQPKVAVIGSGNFGSVIAKVVGENLQRLDNDTEVKMWVFEEDVDGEKLTKLINSQHENVKYLPGIRLPKNVRACPDLSETCRDANVLLFVAPHQFLPSILRQLRGKVSPSTTCLSLIKGVETEGKELKRYTEMIQEALEVENCGAMMGANVAMDIARQDCVESTLAMTDLNLARDLATLFASDHFLIQVADDVHTVELCGALKNVVALGAGICDGLGLGCSSKAAVLRRGIEEIALFCQLTDKTGRFKKDTMFQSCGVGDIIATCMGGRNRLVAEAFARHLSDVKQSNHFGIAEDPSTYPDKVQTEEEASKLWTQLEQDLLHGQRLQGVDTCKAVIRCIDSADAFRDYRDAFPLMRVIHKVAIEGYDCHTLFRWDS